MSLENAMQNHLAAITHFVTICQADKRVLAAFLGGSYAKGTADTYSDVDFGLILSDKEYDTFWANREAFIRSLEEPIFFEDYCDEGYDSVFFTFADGVECELVLGRESQFSHIHVGPYQVLLDKKDILAGVTFPQIPIDQTEQSTTLHRLIAWFWHDLSHHFITPLARGHLWSAYGGLQDLRQTCVNLMRLNENFSAAPEGYEKIEAVVPAGQLDLLAATCCGVEREAMIQAASLIMRVYQQLALPLTQRYGLPYPTTLDMVMSARLDRLRMMT